MKRKTCLPSGLLAVLLTVFMLLASPVKALAYPYDCILLAQLDNNGNWCSNNEVLVYEQPSSGETWSWDGYSTLTIDGFSGWIWCTDHLGVDNHLVLNVAGDSQLFAAFTYASYLQADALHGPFFGDVTITGKGKLDITLGDVDGSIPTGSYCGGITSDNNIVIDGADISIHAGKESAFVYGINADNDIDIVNGSHIAIDVSGIVDGDEYYVSYYSEDRFSYGVGIEAQAITISNSTVYAYGSTNAMNCRDPFTIVNSTIGATTSAIAPDGILYTPLWSVDGFSLSKVVGDTAVEEIGLVYYDYNGYGLYDGDGAGRTHLEPSNKPFKDCTALTPHYDDILWLYENGISTGFVSGSTRTFEPFSNVARCDMAAFLYRLAGSPDYTPSAADKKYFSDVNSSTPHCKEIWWLASTGISRGWDEPNGTHTFRPFANVARCDMAAFLYRLAGSPDYTPSAAERKYFSDITSTSPHANEVWWLASTGVSAGWTESNGRHTFRPYNNVARCDMAAFLHRMDNGGLVPQTQ